VSEFSSWQLTAKTTFWLPKPLLAAKKKRLVTKTRFGIWYGGIRENRTVTKTFGNQNTFWQKTAKTCFGYHS